jgi:2-oxoglutarate dehydrogenase E2 component (dihydrolipoamide succinyltransferase)
MGDSITEGTIQTFMKQIGDYIKMDEIVAVIETDKVNLDIRCAHEGVLTKLFANEGDTVEVNADFFEIDLDGKKGASTPAPVKEAPKETPKPAETKRET